MRHIFICKTLLLAGLTLTASPAGAAVTEWPAGCRYDFQGSFRPGVVKHIDCNLATSAFPGISLTPIRPYDECVYIDNATSDTFFVPLNSFPEWNAFKTHLPQGLTLRSCEADPPAIPPKSSQLPESSTSPAGLFSFHESFESGHDEGVGTWSVYANWNGWTTAGPGIEIDGPGTIVNDVPDGQFHAELDSDSFGTGPHNSTMNRHFELVPGQYRLSWYFRSRLPYSDALVCGMPSAMDLSSLSDSTNRVDVGIVTQANSEIIAADTCLDATSWVLRTLHFTVQQNGTYQIRFAAGGYDESYGGLIDDIRLVQLPR